MTFSLLPTRRSYGIVNYRREQLCRQWYLVKKESRETILNRLQRNHKKKLIFREEEKGKYVECAHSLK